MNNTQCFFWGGPIRSGLDLKADGGKSASAGNTYVSRHGLLQSALIPESLMLMTAKCIDARVTNTDACKMR